MRAMETKSDTWPGLVSDDGGKEKGRSITREGACVCGVFCSSEEGGKQDSVRVQRSIAVVVVELEPLDEGAVEKRGGTWSDILQGA